MKIILKLVIKSEQCWQLLMCKCWANRLYHDWQLTFYHTCSLETIHNKIQMGCTTLTEAHRLIRCVWSGWSLQRWSYRYFGLWTLNAFCLDTMTQLVPSLSFLCYEYYDKMLTFLSLTNGKSVISPQTWFVFFFYIFTTLHNLQKERKKDLYTISTMVNRPDASDVFQ